MDREFGYYDEILGEKLLYFSLFCLEKQINYLFNHSLIYLLPKTTMFWFSIIFIFILLPVKGKSSNDGLFSRLYD